jgi:hypothetical protein
MSEEETKRFLSEELKRVAIEGMIVRMKHLGILFDHYGIKREAPNRWFLLALRLASDYVENFDPVDRLPKPGRRRGNPFTLVGQIDEIEKQRDRGIAAAVREYAKAKNKHDDTIEATYYKRRTELGETKVFSQLLSIWDWLPADAEARPLFEELVASLDTMPVGQKPLQECIYTARQVELLEQLRALVEPASQD